MTRISIYDIYHVVMPMYTVCIDITYTYVSYYTVVYAHIVCIYVYIPTYVVWSLLV